MAVTMAQALAQQIRAQIPFGERVLELSGAGTENDQSGAVIGDPAKVLSVRGNVSDMALTHQLWLQAAYASGAIPGEMPEDLRTPPITTIQEFRGFLVPRETDTSEQALQRLNRVNTHIADAIERLSDEQLDSPVQLVFPGEYTLRDILFRVILHGGLHIGQAWGLLKSLGITEEGFETLRRRS